MLPKVGIIYLTYPTPQWERDIDRCFRSFEKITYPKDRVELICVESKGKLSPVRPWFHERWLSRSGTSLPRITYIFHDEWIGFAGNNNLGLMEAKRLGCEYVYLLNEDTDVDPGFLEKVVDRAEKDARIGIVQSLLCLGEERDRLNSCGNAWQILGLGFSRGYHWSVEEYERWLRAERVTNPDLEIAYASGAGMLARVSALDACGGLFDEAFFMYHEDTDASLRMRIQGWKVVLEPTSVVYHYYEFAKAKINYYWMERNRYALVFMYYHWTTLLLLAPLFAVFDLATWGFAVLRGWADMKWKVLKDLCSPSFWRWIWKRRQEIQTRRTVSERAFLRLSVPEILFQEPSVKNPLLEKVGNPLMRAYWAIVWRILP
ncbi:glycosyltransferase family 2 protein [Patescibacteria group bacterium]|nr:glycosyltransferase family 2 protein [Patescibacteria group bacterium]